MNNVSRIISIAPSVASECTVKYWLPPVLIDWLRALLKRGIRFSGPYSSWENAANSASGYDSAEILERVKQATQLVLQGKAAYERDSVAFSRPQYPFAMLAALMRVAMEHNNRLSVLDFGGSLGSSYFQCRGFLPTSLDLHWSIVEQPNFVKCGKELINDQCLQFFYDADSAVAENRPNVILLASVLQYLPDPEKLLAGLAKYSCPYLIVDRTPLTNLAEDIISVQHVPPSIYRASYPCWIFSKAKVLEILSEKYRLIAEYTGPDGYYNLGRVRFSFPGMILKKL